VLLVGSVVKGVRSICGLRGIIQVALVLAGRINTLQRVHAIFSVI